jgi:hypothetical protein
MSRYSYEKCLERAYRVNWRIEDVIKGREFDPALRWLPSALSGAEGVDFLDAAERRKLSHVEMASYAHLFGYAEEFVAPTVVDLAHDLGPDERDAFDALTHFAAEEIKHMNLFRQIRDRIDQGMGFSLERLGGQQESVRFVRSKHRGAVLLLTACIEWFTQKHYRECFHVDEDLDPFTRHIFKCHWLEESQHAQLDHLETIRAFGNMDDGEKDDAIDDLIELVATVDGWLVEQSGYDVENFGRYVGRVFVGHERARIFDEVLRAKRYTFLVTGVTHPRFLELFAEVANAEQQERVNAALIELLPVLGQESENEAVSPSSEAA